MIFEISPHSITHFTAISSDWCLVESLSYKNTNYAFHHEATAGGYERKGLARIEAYAGRYGNGFKVHINNPKSSRYHVVRYYIKKV